MPPEYTASSSGNNKRLAGTATQFFFAAQIGFSQILMNNDRLSKIVDDQAVEIAKLKKSSSEGREALMGEIRPLMEWETVRAEAGPAYFESVEFQAIDNEKYKTIVGNAVAAIRHWFHMDQPEAVWSTDEIWDAVGAWTDADVNSENEEEEGSPGGDAGGDGGSRNL
ncbi:unnamed protein product [Linum trigynum]|uniref:Uncharacterized protein n=1 Tax=Linum trigynum TaxID=586398 RepID=A0AAV2FV70_9ROSI